jgi:pyruvate formate lyase activating enzyme
MVMRVVVIEVEHINDDPEVIGSAPGRDREVVGVRRVSFPTMATASAGGRRRRRSARRPVRRPSRSGDLALDESPPGAQHGVVMAIESLAGASSDQAHPTRWWHRLADGRVRCDVCPRGCCLREGQRGFCFVRARLDDEIVLTTYGRSSGFCIDPIEKKPLDHFLPGTPTLSFGTAGCNLGCAFCQNWDISTSREWDILADAASPAAIAAAAREHGCRSVAFTYNDPTIFLEYAVDVAAACQELGLRTVAVTAGYIEPGPRVELFGAMDAANVDLKSFDDDTYRRVCLGRLRPVLDTLEAIADEGRTWLEITTLLIPGLNDSDEELDALTSWIVDHLGPSVPLHFTAFHPDHRMRDRPPTPAASLRHARSIGLANGLRYVYTGNVHDPDGQSTWCHACGALLIGRSGYDITAWRLSLDGACSLCGEPCAGVFEPRPGDWGSRRQPIAISRTRPS